MEKVILHCDLNNFYASVECIKHPEYIGLPLAVTGAPEKRNGIVLAKNSLAKSMGVKTGEVIWQAKTKCPNLICLTPTFEDYAKYSKIVKGIYLKYTDYVEPFGIDECWLDVTKSQKLFGNGIEIANKIKQEIKNTCGLTISVGVSFSKMFAKLGSKIAGNDQVVEINKENYKQVAWKLPVEKLIFIGRRRLVTLKKMNINTIGELACASLQMLETNFGISGAYLKQIANGTEPDEVKKITNYNVVKSIGNGTTAIYDIDNFEEAKQVIYFLAEKVCTRMREQGLESFCISLSIEDNELNWIGHSETITLPTDNANTVSKTCIKILNKYWNFNTTRSYIRALRVKCSNLVTAQNSSQIDLFLGINEKDKLKKQDAAIDKIRQKYGYNKIKKALLMQAKQINSEISDDNFEEN